MSDKMINAIKRAFERRAYLFSNSVNDCFRLFNSAGDGIEGLTIDLYGAYILIQYFSEYIHNKLFNTPGLRDSLIRSILELPSDICGILLKNRTELKGSHDYNKIRKSLLLWGNIPQENYKVKTNGIYAFADLINGQNTGIFLDMRRVRDKLKTVYKEKKISTMLNLFSYTSIFSVHALTCGVKNAVNVDLSKRVIKKAKNNYCLNNLNINDRDFIYGDAMSRIKIFRKKNRKFDFIIFDPPTFSRNKKRTFSVKKDYAHTLPEIDKILEPCGHILTCINSFSVSKEEYLSYHPSKWRLIMFENEPEDFPPHKDHYLKAGLWKTG